MRHKLFPYGHHFFLLIFFFIYSVTVDALEANKDEPYRGVIVQSNMQEIGYQLGDVAYQTIVIRTPRDYQLDESSLPAKGKGAASIELRDAQSHAQSEGSETVHTLRLDWQIFRVLQETRSYPIKSLDLQFRKTDKVLTAHVPGGRVFVASVLPTAMKKLTGEMNLAQLVPKGDVPPQPRSKRPFVIALVLAWFGLLASCIYVAWRFDWLPPIFGQSLPFRNAYRQIRQLKQSDTTLLTAMQLLRHAFDNTAGVAISKEQLASLFERVPTLEHKHAEIEQFYTSSELHFFAGATSDVTLKQLTILSRQLMKLEAG